jgi:hypothetical protein
MSSSGIVPVNSGPLIIRTYNDLSARKTYAVTDYDIPVAANHVLITSTSGLVIPSDNIYVSSLSVSSINGLIYPPIDDALWSSDGAGNIYNDNSGNVGIGMSTPAYKLDVNGITQIQSGGANFRFGTTVVNEGFSMAWNTIQANSLLAQTEFMSGKGFGAGTRGGFDFFVNIADDTDASGSDLAMRITGDKKVGINTASPSCTLDVSGNMCANSITTAEITGVSSINGLPYGVILSGIAQFNNPTVQLQINTPYTLTSNSIVQLSWYNDNNANCENPIYITGAGTFSKQVWWNLIPGGIPPTDFQIEIGPFPASVGKYHLIKWALLKI